MATTIADLAAALGGVPIGNASHAVSGAATLETAGPNEITLVDSADKLHLLA
ncbi:MAG TPA: UDP-3-O-(3-hydroxymyristoyl)glucosamine N-acyltransferase, partial [Planctomycetaceae bacterium]|nr:UDP-3-O-(3-hydroxymyristoyl)glucosamine N-acyltransferase [Planctomycetaceae bacterium]